MVSFKTGYWLDKYTSRTLVFDLGYKLNYFFYYFLYFYFFFTFIGKSKDKVREFFFFSKLFKKFRDNVFGFSFVHRKYKRLYLKGRKARYFFSFGFFFVFNFDFFFFFNFFLFNVLLLMLNYRHLVYLQATTRGLSLSWQDIYSRRIETGLSSTNSDIELSDFSNFFFKIDVYNVNFEVFFSVFGGFVYLSLLFMSFFCFYFFDFRSDYFRANKFNFFVKIL
jgi:hypothetical protein